MSVKGGRHIASFGEFVALMATLMSLVALSIDALLPALPIIGLDLRVRDINDTQLIVTLIFLGMAFGQLFYGPLSDSVGRKPAVLLGLGIFVFGCLLSLWAADFQMMLLGRLLQGVGLGGPRIVALALIRDQYSGARMASVMSFVMMVVIVVPMLAPLLGLGVLLLMGWRAIFTVIIVLCLITTCWFFLRQPETLKSSNRVPFSVKGMWSSAREVIAHPIALGHTLAGGFVFSAFLAYLSTVQQILQVQYGLGDLFPLAFACLALAAGLASFLNGRLVLRYGMRRMCLKSLFVMVAISVVFSLVAYRFAGHPPLILLMAYYAVMLFCVGIIFGNMSSIAMEPLGHVAGVGASVVGSLSMLMSVPLAITISSAYDGSVLPILLGFIIFGLASLGLMFWADARWKATGSACQRPRA